MISYLVVLAMLSQFQPHSDMVSSIELCERNERTLVLSSSTDCSVALCDIYGNKIGVFGQVSFTEAECHVLIFTKYLYTVECCSVHIV